MKRRDVSERTFHFTIGCSHRVSCETCPGTCRCAAPKGPLVPGPAIYQSIGVEPLINCMGTYTIIGGSIERQIVREAMDSAAKNFVQYDELATGVGQAC